MHSPGLPPSGPAGGLVNVFFPQVLSLSKHKRKRQPKGSAGHAETRDRRMAEFFMRHEEDATHNTTSRSNVEAIEELSTRNDVGTLGRTVAKAVD